MFVWILQPTPDVAWAGPAVAVPWAVPFVPFMPFVPFSEPRPMSTGVGRGVMTDATGLGLLRGAAAEYSTKATMPTIRSRRCMVM